MCFGMVIDDAWRDRQREPTSSGSFSKWKKQKKTKPHTPLPTFPLLVRSVSRDDKFELQVTGSSKSILLSWRVILRIFSKAENQQGYNVKQPGRIQWGLTYIHDYVQSGWLVGIYCKAQRTLLSALWWSKWEGNAKKGGHMYTYSWLTLQYCRNSHNVGKQLYSNKN